LEECVVVARHFCGMRAGIANLLPYAERDEFIWG